MSNGSDTLDPEYNESEAIVTITLAIGFIILMAFVLLGLALGWW